jgi:predicted flap endonuclease-1-like 5' DNA nuclease
VRGENAQLKAQIDTLGPLRDEIQGLRDKLESTEAQVQELNPLRAENQQLRDTVASLRKSLAQAQEGQTSAGTGASEPAPEAPPEALQGTPSAEDLHVRVKRIAERTSGGESAADDDLKQIRGVGPVIEKMLKAMGITSYRQIANFTNEDIDQVTAAMGSFRGRIRRDSWIDGAREEYRKKYGSDA